MTDCELCTCEPADSGRIPTRYGVRLVCQRCAARYGIRRSRQPETRNTTGDHARPPVSVRLPLYRT